MVRAKHDDKTRPTNPPRQTRTEKLEHHQSPPARQPPQQIDHIAKGQVEEAPLEDSTSVLLTATCIEEIEAWEDELEEGVRCIIPREQRTVMDKGKAAVTTGF
jgi:hypothetical protein